jgi:serine/threonine protein kinase
MKTIKKSNQNQSLTESDVIKLALDLCNALELCHSKSIMHRDIKEANIFVSNNNTYKLGDFGVSKDISNATHLETKVGTINYMPPEIFSGKKYTKNADIYSLGIVLYKLLNHGRIPFLPTYPNEIIPVLFIMMILLLYPNNYL